MSDCHRCDRSFTSARALEQHVADSSSHYVCDECSKDFASEHALHQHCSQKHYYCTSCREVFHSGLGLREHRCSSDPEPTVLSCPLKHICARRFASMSALLQHLEGGTCFADALRSAVPAMIRVDQHDVSSAVNSMERLCTSNTSVSPSSRRVRVRGAQDRILATKGSWNGTAFECVLCHETFARLPLLNRHLRRARKHRALVRGGYYRCTHADGRRACGKKFDELGELLRHVEAGSCGVKKFKYDEDEDGDGDEDDDDEDDNDNDNEE